MIFANSDFRFIPACAGNSCQTAAHYHSGRGSSPRVRGTGTLQHRARQGSRFIPACAGNRFMSFTFLFCHSVHPRVCGEQTRTARISSSSGGSSPRVRGTDLVDVAEMRLDRFIPACAGNRGSAASPCSRRPVHPRVCGEQADRTPPSRSRPGSSPRVRGTGNQPSSDATQRRFIPACAGNSIPVPPGVPHTSVHPRVCGEQTIFAGTTFSSFGSSPRVRGTEPTSHCQRLRSRFIPACAGNSGTRRRRPVSTTVHPRVCGEQGFGKNRPNFSFGSSPRVRGTEFV